MSTPPRRAGPGFGVYIHWPFCLSKCPYCDFNSHVVQRVEAEDWLPAYLNALEWFARRTPGHTVTSVFFGGGTPSLMPPSLLAALLERMERLWPLADDAEITLEANPTSAERANFAAFAAAGVNRLSLGVQALDDAALARLGRTHTAREAIDAFELARKIFPRASFDLITARPGQKPREWERELTHALALEPEHLSVYQLTMEPETPFHRLHERGRLHLPDEEATLAMHRLTREMLAAAGLPAYEVSNFARPGRECRHNLLYWRYGFYAGVGPGAHARLPAEAVEGAEEGEEGATRLAVTSTRHPARWLRQALNEDGAGITEVEALRPRQVALEYLLMSLRTREGLNRARLRALSGHDIAEPVLAELRAQGLLRTSHGEDRLCATEAGLLVLDRVIAELADALAPVNDTRLRNV